MAIIEVKQLDEESIVWMVQELEGFEKDRAIRTGLVSAMSVFKTLGRRNLRRWMGGHGHPEGVTGNLLSSFKNRVKRNKPGALSGFSLPEGSHVWLVDRGTVIRQTRYHDTGIMPASHFWEDAKNQGEGKALDRLLAGVERAIKRINERRK